MRTMGTQPSALYFRQNPPQRTNYQVTNNYTPNSSDFLLSACSLTLALTMYTALTLMSAPPRFCLDSHALGRVFQLKPTLK